VRSIDERALQQPLRGAVKQEGGGGQKAWDIEKTLSV